MSFDKDKFNKYLDAVISDSEEYKADRERIASLETKTRQTYIHLEFHLLPHQAAILCKMIAKLEVAK